MTKPFIKVSFMATFFLVFAAASLSSAQSNTTPDNESKQHDIKKLMELRKVQEIINDRTAKNIEYCLKTYPDLPTDVWLKLIGGPNGKVLYDTIFAVYDNNLSAEEAHNLLAVQSTQDLTRNPDLMRLVSKINPMMTKSVEDILRKLIKKLQPELKKYGYEVSEEELYKKITESQEEGKTLAEQDHGKEHPVSQ